MILLYVARRFGFESDGTVVCYDRKKTKKINKRVSVGANRREIKRNNLLRVVYYFQKTNIYTRLHIRWTRYYVTRSFIWWFVPTSINRSVLMYQLASITPVPNNIILLSDLRKVNSNHWKKKRVRPLNVLNNLAEKNSRWIKNNLLEAFYE